MTVTGAFSFGEANLQWRRCWNSRARLGWFLKRGKALARILVIGASKGIGLEAVRQGLACGHEVRAFARGADQIPLSSEKLERCKGDALNSRDVAAALQGVDAVIQALGVPMRPDTVLNTVHLFSESTRILTSAMEEAGVSRLICVTGFGAGDSRKRINPLQRIPFEMALGRVYDDKSVQEKIIRSSALDWVIARPVILTNGPMTGRYRVLVDAEAWRGGFISRADVAHFVIEQVENDAYLGKPPVLLKFPL